MAKFKIIPIKHMIKGNQFAKSGDIVDGSKFIDLQASINGGYAEEVKEKNQAKKAEKGAKESDKKVNSEISKELKVLKKLSLEDLTKYAVTMGIEVVEGADAKSITNLIVEVLEKEATATE